MFETESADSFTDVLFSVLLTMIMMIGVMILFMNPTAKEDATKPNGNIAVTINWPEGDTDVDLWIDGPIELAPVGYSNRVGISWDLLRDDRGTSLDPIKANFENATARGLVDGSYTFNLHCYRCSALPIPVSYEIAVNDAFDGKVSANSRVILTGTSTLTKSGQEMTFANFKMDAKGRIIDGTLNHVFRSIRSGRK